ncbi:phenol-soluble modulin export ABC transporter ATP-binding protein PmtA [Numidum massiliense]|uniref:phenol-soluble modulin export ABC transporter ATP-binding protein PmtA n=1 Tax=Numidum massiliense TaxID=1522315 RepID=UPI0006D59CDB|nr:ABC transporter ATP-binding protein [Numidum massiliense]
MENTVKLTNVSKAFANFHLQDVSFAIKRGYITGFIGPNGAGKTTTIKLMMNLLTRDSGAIEIFGKDVTNNEQSIKQRIGFVYADNCFYEHLTIAQMKRVIAPFYEQWDDTVFEQYRRAFNLQSNKKIKQLSKGMKTKFALAVALSHDADLIVMDEPTSGLDPVFRREILDILANIIQDEEKTVFFSTHITSDLEHIADYITFIHDGRIVFSETKDDVLAQYRLVKGSNELLDCDTRKLFTGVRETSVGFTGLTRQAELAQQLFGAEAVFETPSLEDIMVYTARGSRHA